MYYTGLDPFTKKPVFIAKGLRDRKTQRALMQFFKSENYFEVRDALRQAGRTDLIGDGCDALIPSKPPKEALLRRRKDANARFRGEYVHTIKNAAGQGGSSPSGEGKQRKGRRKQSRRSGTSTGYRPGRPGLHGGPGDDRGALF